MLQLTTLDYVLWALNSAVLAVLLALLFLRRNYRLLPCLTSYLLLNAAQSVILLVDLHYHGYASEFGRRVYWIPRGVIVIARSLAVVELGRRLLRAYPGIWGLSWRFLALCSAAICFYSVYSARQDPGMAILRLDRGLELAIAFTAAGYFVFVRYYRLPVGSAEKMMAVGFCLLSCAWVATNAIFEVFGYEFLAYWRYVGEIACLGVFIIWTCALRHKLPPVRRQSEMLEENIYQQLSPEINRRLRHLNDRPFSFWKRQVRET